MEFSDIILRSRASGKGYQKDCLCISIASVAGSFAGREGCYCIPSAAPIKRIATICVVNLLGLVIHKVTWRCPKDFGAVSHDFPC